MLVLTSIVVPSLDQDRFTTLPVVEAEHHASTCATGHDHTICSQVLGGRWNAPTPSVPWQVPSLLLSVRSGTREALPDRFFSSDSHPRAPPLA